MKIRDLLLFVIIKSDFIKDSSFCLGANAFFDILSLKILAIEEEQSYESV